LETLELFDIQLTSGFSKVGKILNDYRSLTHLNFENIAPPYILQQIKAIIMVELRRDESNELNLCISEPCN